jgi:chemotaxis protein MotB
VSHERWLVSYADFITLLFAFFAVMYAVSSVDARKMETFAKGVRVAFDESSEGDGVLPGGQGVLPSEGNALAELAATVQQQLADELASERLNVRVEPRGVIISVPEAGTFTTGNDELSDQARTLMASIAETVREIPNEIRVEGHSDNVPIRTTRFQSNWDLSAARASRVVEFLIEQNISPERLSATGYAEFQPRVANDSDAARALNRRIDLVLTTEQPGTGGDEP